MSDPGFGDPALLARLARARMPFGRHAGQLLIDLPEGYVLWFSRQGLPAGELGELLAALLVIKENGLESLLRPLAEGRVPDSGGGWREGS